MRNIYVLVWLILEVWQYILFLFRGHVPKGEDLLAKEDVVKLKRCIFSAQVGF